MFKLIKNIEVYQPKYIGKKDLLICGQKMVKIADSIDYPDAIVMDKSGYRAIPGIIDQHIHVTGGGGEGGFHTRTNEVMLSDLVKNGVTTVVGLLGTDALTRSVESLLAKTKALKAEGITAFCLTGSYAYPTVTLTGSVSKDIAFVEEIIGVKLAISDHRESFIQVDELKRLASEVRVASMVSKKSGFITLHMGDCFHKLTKVFTVLKETSLPIGLFRPTHVNRNDELFEESLLFLEAGGTIDITVGPHQSILNAVNKIKQKQLPLNRLTFSSDGNGSYSSYDETGQLIKIGVASCGGIIQTMQYLKENGLLDEEILQFGTTNVAHALGIHDYKGYIKEGYDADLLIVDDQYKINSVFALGKMMMDDGELKVKGTFE